MRTPCLKIVIIIIIIIINSALHFVASSFKATHNATIYADLPGFLSPCIITGDSLRSDMLVQTADKCLYIIELTIGFETNLGNNTARKDAKYRQLLRDLCSHFKYVKLVNVLISCLGIFGHSCVNFVFRYARQGP